MSRSRRRKTRTRAHVIGEMSVNFLERQVLRRRHQLLRVPQPEYGTDAMMLHFSDAGEIENGQVQFQLKATDNLRLVDRGRSVTVTVESAHLHHWYWELDHPFILVLYDAVNHRGFWLDVQEYVDENCILDDQLDQRIVTLRIPVRNRLTLLAVDRFRSMSVARMRKPPGVGD